jgi:putative acetyltransferase
VGAEGPGDEEAVFGVNRLAFGGEEGGQVIGHIFSDLPFVTEQGAVPALALAPLAVVPARQRQGVGILLVREGL